MAADHLEGAELPSTRTRALTVRRRSAGPPLSSGEMEVVQVLPAASVGSSTWLSLTRRAKLLSWTSLAWLCIEGSVAVVAGISAGSIALVGFGLDSAIE